MEPSTLFSLLPTTLPAWAWKGAALLLAAVLVDRALRRRPSALRHLLWSGTLAGLVALPLLGPVLPRLAVSVPLPRALATLLPRETVGVPSTEGARTAVAAAAAPALEREAGRRAVPALRADPPAAVSGELAASAPAPTAQTPSHAAPGRAGTARQLGATTAPLVDER